MDTTTPRRLTGLGLAAALALGGLFVVAPAAHAAGTGTISGTISDDYSGVSLSGASVSFYDHTTGDNLVGTVAVNSAGHYTSPALSDSDEYTASASVSGYGTAWLYDNNFDGTVVNSAATAYNDNDYFGITADADDDNNNISVIPNLSIISGSVVAPAGSTFDPTADVDVYTGVSLYQLNADGTLAGSNWSSAPVTSSDATTATFKFAVPVGTAIDQLSVQPHSAAHAADSALRTFSDAYGSPAGWTAYPFESSYFVANANISMPTLTLMPKAHVTGTVVGDGTHSVNGTSVRFANTKPGIGWPTVSADPATGAFDAWVTPGAYKIMVNGNSYYASTWLGGATSASASTQAIDTDAAVGNLQLQAGTSISGTIAGAPVGSGITLYTAGEDESWIDDSTVASNGSFTFQRVAPGTYKLKVNNSWLGGASFGSAQVITVGSTPVTGLSFTMPKTGRVKGSVLGANGAKANVNVQFTDHSTGVQVLNTGVEDGSFVAYGVPVGTYDVTFTDYTGTYVKATAPATVTADAETLMSTVQLQKLLINSGVPALTNGNAKHATAQVGDTLSATAGTWSLSGLVPSFQWMADGKAIAGATSATFTVTKTQAAKAISVSATGAPKWYAPVTVSSASTSAIITTSNTTFSATSKKGSLTIKVKVAANGGIAAGKVTVKVGKKSYALTLGKKGTASKTIKKLKKGKTTVSATYKGSKLVLTSKAKAKKVTIK